jgi:hypothetical protein
VGVPPEGKWLQDLRRTANRYEHPLHYFEPDAFLRNGKVTEVTITLIPTDSFLLVFSKLSILLAENIHYIESLAGAKEISNPEHPTSRDVAAHGTAPWRIRQLWKFGTRSLIKQDYEHALMYLGAMGHYVGDCTQPFHGTLDFDGKEHEQGSAEGVHSSYETKIFDQVAKNSNSEWDKVENVWSNFDATEEKVTHIAQKTLERTGGARIKSNEIVGKMMNVVTKEHPFISPVEDAFAEAKEKKNEGAKTIRVATVREFMGMRVENPDRAGAGSTVLETAERELGTAAGVLAQLWLSAYEVAKAKNPGLDLSQSPVVEFSEELVLKDYPKPYYLPEVHGDMENDFLP